jgi:hypothetical protein
MQALSDFRNYDVFSYLSSGYDVLHTQGKNFIVTDIQDFIKKHKQQ